jgi:two-component system chemotaxis response regulator CheY
MKKVLIVEDSMTMRRIVKNVVKQMGFLEENIYDAEDGVKGWELLKANNDFDLVLTDWNMPNMNGLELTKKIRSEYVNRGVTIFMITTEGGKTEVITALKAGVNNYMVKPFNAATFKEKIDALKK